MNLSKKALSVFLAFVMVLVAIPLYGIQSFAVTSGDFVYEPINSTTAELTGYIGQGGDVSIPSEIDGYTIVSIITLSPSYDPDFSIETLTIPASVEAIDPYATALLFGCSEFIVDSNNAYYTSVNGVLFNKAMTEVVRYPSCKSGSEYTVPSGVSTIGLYSFALCNNLERVVLQSGVEEIQESAFASSEMLSDIVIPNGLLSIGGFAFYCCSSIIEIELPSSISYIGDGAFEDTSLSTIYGESGSYADTYANSHGYTFVEHVVPTPTPGDMNDDGVLDNNDIADMLAFAVGNGTPSSDQLDLGDYNDDGVIDGFDVAYFDCVFSSNNP